MIYITGDTHGDWRSRLNHYVFPEGDLGADRRIFQEGAWIKNNGRATKEGKVENTEYDRAKRYGSGADWSGCGNHRSGQPVAGNSTCHQLCRAFTAAPAGSYPAAFRGAAATAVAARSAFGRSCL